MSFLLIQIIQSLQILQFIYKLVQQLILQLNLTYINFHKFQIIISINNRESKLPIYPSKAAIINYRGSNMMKKSTITMLPNGLLRRAPQINNQQWTVEMIQKIISLEDMNGDQYLNKNSQQQILVKIDKQHIQVIDKFSNYREKGFNLLQFVRFFLNILQHDQIENLYLTIGLIDLFKSISTFAGQERINFNHITNFLCEKILQKQQSKNQIQSKNIPQITFINPKYEIKDFIRNPPTIYGSNQQTLYKLSPTSIITDKSKHNRAVNWSIFSYDLKLIFTLDVLSQFIAVYDFHCTQINKIYPSFSKIKKDVVILGFSFSQRQSRIGAVLKNFSIIFWDRRQSNNFDYQKYWSTTSHCQHLQSSIHYLEYFNDWITSDKTGTIYFWDLLNSRPHRHFKCKYSSSINALCEISALNIVAVVQQTKQLSPQMLGLSSFMLLSAVTNNDKKNSLYEFNITLYNFFTGEILNEIISPDDRVPHTIQYSEQYQMMFSAGMEKKIKMWEINPIYMDSSLKGELIGHQNLITSFTLIRKSCLLASCDDKGRIKLWDFRNYACIQTIDFSDKSLIANLLDMVEIGKLGILGSRIHFIDFEDKHQVVKKIKNKQKLIIDWVDFDQCRNQVYVFTQKDLRVIDLSKGVVKYIYGGFGGSQNENVDCTCFRYFSSIFKFAIGNDRGQVSLYDISTGAFSFQLKCQHQGSIIGIQYDQLNKLFITIGHDSAIIIHRQNTKQPIRQLRGNFYGKEITCFQLSVFHNVIAIATHNNEFNRSIFLWNYQHGKLSGEVIINKDYDVVAMQFINGYGILVIATSGGRVNLVRVKGLTGAELRLEEVGFMQLPKGITSITCDITLRGGKRAQLQQCVLIASFQTGSFQQINLTSYLTKFQLFSHSKQRSNYNPYRQSKQTFSFEYTKKKHFILQLQNTATSSATTVIKYDNRQQSPYLQLEKKKQNNIIESLTIEIDYDEELEAESQDAGGDNNDNDDDGDKDKDKVDKFEMENASFTRAIQQQKEKHLKSYNPKQSITEIIIDSQPISSGCSQLNTLKLMNYQTRFLLIVGNSRRLKIFTQKLKLICDLNINYPLPYLWSFKPKINKKIQDKIYFAMKVLNSIIHKYDRDISVGQAKNYKLKMLFNTINPKTIASSQSSIQSPNKEQTVMLTQPVISLPSKFKKHSQQQKIPLVQEEFTKKDLNFNLVKQYNFHQIAGPTLKEFDHIKKMQLIQKQWKQKEKMQEKERENLLRMIQTKTRKNQEKQEISSFLSPTQKMKDNNNRQPPYILNFRKRIQITKPTLQKDIEDKEKERIMPYINQSKTMTFNCTPSRNQSKKGLSDKSLKSSLNKLSSSEKTLSRFNVTSFEDYYSTVRDKHNNSSKLLMRINKTLQGPDYSKFQDKSKNWEQILGVSFRSEKTSTQITISNQSVKQSISSGSKFRKILTEMNEKVREKKILKVKLT